MNKYRHGRLGIGQLGLGIQIAPRLFANGHRLFSGGHWITLHPRKSSDKRVDEPGVKCETVRIPR
jgi:hypothetical protein